MGGEPLFMQLAKGAYLYDADNNAYIAYINPWDPMILGHGHDEVVANKELESFNYISSHDLQEPLRKIQIYASRLIADESQNLSDKGKEYVIRMQGASSRMQALIADLLAYSRTTTSEQKFKTNGLGTIIESVKKDLAKTIAEKKQSLKQMKCAMHI